MPNADRTLPLDVSTERQKKKLAEAQAQPSAYHRRDSGDHRRRTHRRTHRRAREGSAREGEGDGDDGGDPDDGGGSDDGGFVTGPQLCRRYGVSEQSIWRWRHDPALDFPKPMTINRRNYWRLADLIEWERRRARRDAAA